MTYEKKLEQFCKERDEAVLSFDVAIFKDFYRRWVKLGVYESRLLPPDNIIEISLRQMVLGLANPPEDKLSEAKEWLLARGYSLDLFK